MKAWSFSTDSHPRAERAEAWREAMSRLGLPIEGLSDAEPASASVVCLTSPLGIEFALVEAGAQAISGRRAGQPAAIWLAVLLSGEATLVTDDLAEDLAPGDIAYGPTGQAAALRLETRCRLMFVRAPRVALDHRLITPVSLRVGRLQASTGVAHILSGLLRATAEGLEDLTVDQLRPVELALTEFLAICLVEAGAQAISGRLSGQPAAVWLAVLLSGEATLVTDDLAEDLAPGDIAYGPTGQAAALRLETRCRLMFVRAPRVALDHRLIAPVNLRVGRLECATGVAHILSGLLRATADGLEDLTVDQLRPVELALTEFLAICLVEGGAASDILGAGAGAPTAHLQRLCQTIETLLPDPDLSLRRVADEEGVSPRYVQKLFASADETFSHYLRTRRLERCRTDLGSPQHARLSISEICFRWGFNGSAHFSRAFRDQYGVSPREFRQSAAA